MDEVQITELDSLLIPVCVPHNVIIGYLDSR